MAVSRMHNNNVQYNTYLWPNRGNFYKNSSVIVDLAMGIYCVPQNVFLVQRITLRLFFYLLHDNTMDVLIASPPVSNSRY